MKYLWLTVGASTLLLTGCSGMMYGDNTAPVNNRNVYSGNAAPLNNGNANPNGAFAQSTQPNIQAQPVYTQQNPNPNQVNGQRQGQVTPYGQNPTLAQTAAQQNQNVNVNANQGYTPVQQASPYGRANSNTGDGWNVSPNNANTSNNTGADQPKVDNTKVDDTNDSKPQAVRPPQRDVQDNSSNGAQNTGSAANQNQSSNTDSGNKPASQSQTDQQVASANPPPPANNTSGSSETAVSSLLKKASSSLGKGDLDGAVGYLENAQRIDPKNSKILYDIANIRYHQGKHREAESFASRAVQVGGSNSMMKKSWSLIANARKALGDNQGAIMAAEKATSY